MKQLRLDPEFRKREAEKAKIWRSKFGNTEIHRARVRASRRKRMMNPESKAKGAANTRANYRRIRQKLFNLYGAACACCGETEPMFLEIDHVNGGGHKHYKARSAYGAYRDMIKEGRSPLYQLLCSNCNRGRQRNGGVCPHQSEVKQTLRLVI
jgi:hypothetical protein